VVYIKIIFLDIDGVLNYINSEILDENCLYNLEEIVRQTNAKIVITSTWKQFWEHPKLEFHKYKISLVSKLKQHNMEIYDFAPNLKRHRTKEVQQWLKEHVDIESFVVIDDWAFDFKLEMKDNFVQTCWYDKGLEENHRNKAIEILMK